MNEGQMANSTFRCSWCGDDPLYVAYHDLEWGVPVHDDQKLFEMICLEGAQAGLSWITVLRRREGYRRAFHNFEIQRISEMDEAEIVSIIADPGVIRHQGKIRAVVAGAKATLKVQAEFGSLDRYLWSFVNHQPFIRNCQTLQDIPVSTAESVAMSKDLRVRGFNFVGPTICYAFMQATGMVNDHLVDCFCFSGPATPYAKAMK